MTQLPKETRRLRPAQGARSHCPPVPGRQTLPRQQRGQRERPPGLLTPRPQALPPAWCPCPAPPPPGLVPASQRWGAGPCSGHCGGPGPTPGVFPEQPGATQASTPQPMRTALSPCPPSHRAETCPRQHLPQTRNGQSSDTAVDPGDQGKCPVFTDSPAQCPEAGGHGRAPSRFSYSQLTPGTTTMCEGSEQSPGATAPGVSSRLPPQPPTLSPPRAPQRPG